MDRRNRLGRSVSHWSAWCEWFVRRAPFPPDRSVRLLTFFAKVTGLPRPCPAVAPS